MKNKTKESGLILMLLFISSYLLNFIWESIHRGLYASGVPNLAGIAYRCAVIDAFLILVIFFIVALLWKDIRWIERMSREQAYVVVLIGLIIAAIIEYRAVFLLEKWSYAPTMPIVFGIGLSPLVQLSVTGLLAMWVVKRLYINHQ